MGFLLNMVNEYFSAKDQSNERRLLSIENKKLAPTSVAVARIKGELRAKYLLSSTRGEIAKARKALESEDYVTGNLEAHFARHFAALVGLFTKQTGEEYPGLDEFLTRFFSGLNFSSVDCRKYAKLSSQIRPADIPWSAILDFLNTTFTYTDRKEVIALLYSLAALNANVSEQEEAIIQVVAEELGIQVLDRLELRSEFWPEDQEMPEHEEVNETETSVAVEPENLNPLGQFILSTFESRKYEVPLEHTFICPNIPVEKLSNALQAYGNTELATVLVLVDNTVWGSAKDGAMLGETGILYHNMSSKPRFLPWSMVSAVSLAEGMLSKDIVLNSGFKIGVSVLDKTEAEFLVSLIQQILDFQKSSSQEV